MNRAILNMELRVEHDVVLARQRARQIAGLLGFDSQDQTRIATAVSEIARNAFRYAGGGRIEFTIEGDEKPRFQIIIRDRGPGIQNIQDILDGRYSSSTGMGVGIVGTRRLMDSFHIESTPDKGTIVRLSKDIPPKSSPLTSSSLGKVAEELAKRPIQNPFEEIQQQNQDLLQALQQLQDRQVELAQLNRELEDTNRGVVALYSELDEKADYLRRASEMKSRFLSNMSHEFRTPLNSIAGLTRLLLDRIDGDLTAEQEKQVSFIRKAAEDLMEIVNDLLDLAKVESGKVVIRPHDFEVGALFGALRGMLKPLLVQNNSVSLLFDEVKQIPLIQTDESKVSQILRNFISNALKFTEKGEIRVSATLINDQTLSISVSDTGIGIAPEDRERIFQEFIQVENESQKRVKGTGLGLPLARKLAALLGGEIYLRSQVGVGSTFTLRLPLVYQGPTEVASVPEITTQRDFSRFPILVVEDNRETLFIYEKYLKGTGFQVIPAHTIKAAHRILQEFRPAAIILDVLLETENSWDFLEELKQSAETRSIPVLVVTMVENQHKAIALGANDFSLKPIDRSWLLDKLKTLAKPSTPEKILIIDDDEVSRYLLKGLLGDTRYEVIETEGGRDGLEVAIREHPQAIFLDLDMPDLSGFEVLEQLRSNPTTEKIPVIIHTSKVLEEKEARQLASRTSAFLSKTTGSREVAIARVRDALRKAGLA